MADLPQAVTGIAEAASAGKTATAIAGAAAAASATAVAPPEPSVWAILVLGIPLGVLAAALAGAATRYLREPPQPEGALVPKLIGTLTDGFVGGWLAMLLLALPITSDWLGKSIAPEVVGALCALGMQYLRTKVPEWIDGLVRNVLSWFGKRSGGSP